MNEDYIERYSQDRVQYIANMIAIHDWIAWRDVSGADNLLLSQLRTEITKQLSYFRKVLESG